MELNIAELNNLNTMNPYEIPKYENYTQEDTNYWDNNKANQPKKKKITFNDILSNMNLVVNNQGVLQYMGINDEMPQETPLPQNQYNSNDFTRQIKYQPQEHQGSYNLNQPPIDPSVKHSYIYNKYFKDYTDNSVEKPGPRVPKTIEEYHQMLLDDKIKAIEHKKRIEQIKSKKMMFTSVPGVQSNPRNIKPSVNNLRMMNFR